MFQQRIGPQEFVRLVSYKDLLQSLLEVDWTWIKDDSYLSLYCNGATSLQVQECYKP